MFVVRIVAVTALVALPLGAAQAAEKAATAAAPSASAATGKKVPPKNLAGAKAGTAAGDEVLNHGTGGQGSTIKPIPKPKLDPKVMNEVPVQQTQQK